MTALYIVVAVASVGAAIWFFWTKLSAMATKATILEAANKTLRHNNAVLRKSLGDLHDQLNAKAKKSNEEAVATNDAGRLSAGLRDTIRGK